MKIINFGSLNIDRVYSVDHFVQPGETLASNDYKEFGGGKGLNQSIALARAGAKVYHAGKIGTDGAFLKKLLDENSVDTSLVHTSNNPTGHAIIQVNNQGENSILLYGGTNQCIRDKEIQQVINRIDSGDWLLLQNEISGISSILSLAAEKGAKIVFNPAPMTKEVLSLPLQKVELLIVNEIEGEMLTGQLQPDTILDSILEKYPQISVVLTHGDKGAFFARGKERIYAPAEVVTTVDTTGAGDTFIGYFLSEISRGTTILNSLETATKAAAICVTRHGAAASIPLKNEVHNS